MYEAYIGPVKNCLPFGGLNMSLFPADVAHERLAWTYGLATLDKKTFRSMGIPDGPRVLNQNTEVRVRQQRVDESTDILRT
ncbi:hypothetical protein FRX31_007769 [Thalictrum thalictroides]|uniref:Uncharacterized protein n=1 Tax=Thalictrum thalictroides TaxID=46969 RepID=A0A7J6WYZ8_THATH|nr:hypothetical protein FRX31_007769 [Thalictrum thalictroides]